MSEEIETRRHAATLAYEDAGREISQAFDVLNANLTLAAGTLGALLTVLGAGELFGQSIAVLIDTGPPVAANVGVEKVSGIPELSSVSLLLLAAALPLLFRFYFRATLGYQQLRRFNVVQRDMWAFLSGQASWEVARTTAEIYVQTWRSPERLSQLFTGNLKYGFAWVFALALTVVAWGFVTAPDLTPKLVAGSFLTIAAIWEWVTIRRMDVFTTPSAEEEQALAAARSIKPAGPVDPRTPAPRETIETGFFAGRRRWRNC